MMTDTKTLVRFVVGVLLPLLLSRVAEAEAFSNQGQPVAGGQGQRGTITGRVEIRSAPPSARMERGARYRTGSAPKASESKAPESDERKNVVIYLEDPTLPSSPADDATATLDQVDVMFVPHVLAVQKGTKVNVVNHDKVYHNVFSLSGPKKFNIGRRPAGEAVPVRFDNAGVIQIFCDIHSQMSAFIIVLENRYYAQPGEDGTYTIMDVPPGTYTLKVWHERYAAPAQRVTVDAAGTSTSNFVLQ